MTATINGHKTTVTDGGDVRMCVRAPETPAEAPGVPVERDPSTYTRVIQEPAPKVKPIGKIRDAASLHAVDLAQAAMGSWALNERPPSVGDAWRTALPAKGEASKAVWPLAVAAGLFRAVGITVLWLFALAIAGRRRAGVALALTFLTVAALAVAGAVR